MKKMKMKFLSLLLVLVVLSTFFVGCSKEELSEQLSAWVDGAVESGKNQLEGAIDSAVDDLKDAAQDAVDDAIGSITGTGNRSELKANGYNGTPYVVVNNNEPYFTDKEKENTDAFEKYAKLDRLGRCGVAYANICKELMPTADRESISSVTPTGWENNKYDFVDGGWIYNRSHLIGFQLSGENANEKNLITGTRYMNVQGMLPFENMIDDYVDETGNHVLYRVTPIFTGNNLLCEGVLMEAWSVEDNGDGICFNVFCYNVQPGVTIDYATGENWVSE
jgi:DNA-entry nuclease